MFVSENFGYLWHQWVNLFAGLPFDKHASAYIALVVVFWAIGTMFKVLVQK